MGRETFQTQLLTLRALSSELSVSSCYRQDRALPPLRTESYLDTNHNARIRSIGHCGHGALRELGGCADSGSDRDQGLQVLVQDERHTIVSTRKTRARKGLRRKLMPGQLYPRRGISTRLHLERHHDVWRRQHYGLLHRPARRLFQLLARHPIPDAAAHEHNPCVRH